MKCKFVFFILFIVLYSCSAIKSDRNNWDTIDENAVHLFAVGHRENTKFGYQDRFEKELISPKYELGRQFSEGLAAVRLNGKWGFINRLDSVVIPFQYDWVGSFGEYGFEGLAIVKIGGDLERVFQRMNGKTGFINHSGELVVPMKYQNFRPVPGSPIMEVTNERGKFGYINMKAEEIIPCLYDSTFFSLGSDSVCMFKNGSGYWFNIKGK